jgi:hypothetical protein
MTSGVVAIVRKLLNTPHGSVGIVQVQPTLRRTVALFLFLSLSPLAMRGERGRETTGGAGRPLIG